MSTALLLVRARVVKSVDTADLKSAAHKRAYQFDSGLGHHPYRIRLPSRQSYSVTSKYVKSRSTVVAQND